MAVQAGNSSKLKSEGTTSDVVAGSKSSTGEKKDLGQRSPPISTGDAVNPAFPGARCAADPWHCWETPGTPESLKINELSEMKYKYAAISHPPIFRWHPM